MFRTQDIEPLNLLTLAASFSHRKDYQIDQNYLMLHDNLHITPKEHTILIKHLYCYQFAVQIIFKQSDICQQIIFGNLSF